VQAVALVELHVKVVESPLLSAIAAAFRVAVGLGAPPPPPPPPQAAASAVSETSATHRKMELIKPAIPLIVVTLM
jgi:hypothetical protein